MGTVVQGGLRCQVWGSFEGRVSDYKFARQGWEFHWAIVYLLSSGTGPSYWLCGRGGQGNKNLEN